MNSSFNLRQSRFTVCIDLTEIIDRIEWKQQLEWENMEISVCLWWEREVGAMYVYLNPCKITQAFCGYPLPQGEREKTAHK